MQIRFVPTEQDWRNTATAAPTPTWSWFQFFLSFVPLFFLGGFLATSGFEIAGYACMTASIGIALAGYEIPRSRQWKLIRSSALAYEERIVAIDERGVTMTLPHGHSQYDWCVFSKCRETSTYFLFFMPSQRVSFWIPKRAMHAAQIEELRGILKMRMTALEG